jgi:DNA helicase II / ATP-dependent DNA helicase PcrA
LNAIDGCIPSDLAAGSSEEIEEERRLLYVAMTRARDELNLIVPQRFYKHGQARSGDRHVYGGRTRFIPASLCGQFNRISWPPAPPAMRDAPKPGPHVDIRERMRGMWSKVS